jgi:small-conductance mechanosensitive channel
MTSFESFLKNELFDPTTITGAIVWAVILLAMAVAGARAIRTAVTRILERDHREVIDRATASFVTQVAIVGVYVLAATFYAHIVPALHRVGLALLTGVSVASVVFGLAAQNTLGNLIAGVSLLLYRPVRVDDLVQVTTPNGAESGVVEQLTLGYTVLRTPDDRRIVIPNSVMASQVLVNLDSRALRFMAIVPVVVRDPTHVEPAREALIAAAKAHPDVVRVIGCPVLPITTRELTVSLRAWSTSKEAAQRVEADINGKVAGILASLSARA